MGRFSLKSLWRRAAGISLVLISAIAPSGCNQQTQQTVQTNSRAAAGPEESFDRILGHVKRLLEHRPQQVYKSTGLEPDSGETSHFSYQEEVTGELIPSEAEGDPPQARIVIRTTSNYIHILPVEPEEEEGEDDSGSSLDVLIGPDGEAAAGGDLPELPEIEPPGNLTADSASSSESQDDITSLPTDTERDAKNWVEEYLLAYKDGRWELITEVEEGTSIKEVFDYALEIQ